jgi:hypothetical protein
MNRRLLVNHLVLCVILALPSLAVRQFDLLAFSAAVDLILFAVCVLSQVRSPDFNVLAPSLWAISGYIVFGQMPILLNYFMGVYREWGYDTTNDMMALVLVGYRVMLLGIVLQLSRVSGIKACKLPDINLVLPSLLITTGLLARILIRNNLQGMAYTSWVWYYALFFTCTPIGLSFLFTILGERKEFSNTSRKFIVYSLIAFVIFCALIDASRKDTGMLLLSIIIFVFFKVSPQLPYLRLDFGRLIKLFLVMCVLGFILMAVRAFSWTQANQSGFAEEILTSFNERRANDTTNILAFVMQTTPSQYPYLYGLTLGSILPVPRSIFPYRPAAHSYYVGLQWRGVHNIEYDPKFMGDNQLSISAHMLGEGYANFGLLGAVLFEFLYGYLIGTYEARLRQGRLLTLRIIYPIMLFFIFTQQRGDIAMMNTSWMMSSGIMWLLLIIQRRFLNSKFRWPTRPLLSPTK